jgi:hypothetical protein
MVMVKRSWGSRGGWAVVKVVEGDVVLEEKEESGGWDCLKVWTYRAARGKARSSDVKKTRWFALGLRGTWFFSGLPGERCLEGRRWRGGCGLVAGASAPSLPT